MRLLPHPAVPGACRLELDASVERHGTSFAFEFRLAGELARVRWPPAAPPLRSDGLWRRTCFEAFLAAAGPGYVELNFAPSAQWAAYAFGGYRDAVHSLELARAPRIELERDDECACLRARLEAPELFAALGAAAQASELRLALSAVIEDDSGALGYWALRHPSGRPDFHHPGSFALVSGPAPTGETIR